MILMSRLMKYTPSGSSHDMSIIFAYTQGDEVKTILPTLSIDMQDESQYSEVAMNGETFFYTTLELDESLVEDIWLSPDGTLTLIIDGKDVPIPFFLIMGYGCSAFSNDADLFEFTSFLDVAMSNVSKPSHTLAHFFSHYGTVGLAAIGGIEKAH